MRLLNKYKNMDIAIIGVIIVFIGAIVAWVFIVSKRLPLLKKQWKDDALKHSEEEKREDFNSLIVIVVTIVLVVISGWAFLGFFEK